MPEHVSSALFIHNDETAPLCQRLMDNPYGTHITCQDIDSFIRATESGAIDTEHVVVSGPLALIKKIICLSLEHGFSIGLLLDESQKNLRKHFDLPTDPAEAIDLALKSDAPSMDVVICNGHLLLFKATAGWMPILDAPSTDSRTRILIDAIRKFIGLRLRIFSFSTANEQKVKTAASGCMIIHQPRKNLADRLVPGSGSVCDGALSLFVASPFSILEYLKFLLQSFSRNNLSRLPKAIGYIKSRHITIEADQVLDVYIDGEAVTHTPLHCQTLPEAISINLGDWLVEENQHPQMAKESIRIDNLPNEKELAKSTQKKIPFFSYASEERFRDLFMALREDARTSSFYLVLMVLSTLLATVGLYQNSNAVLIGAMLLAPLMAPIVSLAMGLLRHDENLLKYSMRKIAIGIIIALLASALFAFLFPYRLVTSEMQARLNPTLLDLAVAILAGIAAAYSKSFREIVQSLAGVAIAVALVPPLAVAGIGLGLGDVWIFLSAFLLFSTNLIGIVLASTYTFRVLGYSPVVRHKLGIRFVTLALLLIIIPLYISYQRIASNIIYEQSLLTERFIVNGKYIIVRNAKIVHDGEQKVIEMNIVARETLNRQDLNKLRFKIQRYFDTRMKIRTTISYIL